MAKLPENPQSGWGMDWGEFWGGDLESFDFFQMCKRLTWKHLEGLPNIGKLCTFLAEVFAELDAESVIQARKVGIDQATGEDLDGWGQMVGLPRFGAGDDLYRRGIKAAAIAILSQAEPGSLYDIAETIAPNGKILLLEVFPACFRIYFFDMTPDEQTVVGSVIGLCRGLGICGLGVFIDPNGVFEWQSIANPLTIERHWNSQFIGSIPTADHAGFASLRPL